MKTAYVFPGQGAQFVGMGKGLCEQNPQAKELFQIANGILGFSISDIMADGTPEQLKQTNVTQPAVFIHSAACFLAQVQEQPDMVAGHSLGEFSALVAAGVLSFENALRLVAERATAMQAACEQNPSTMAAILGLEDEIVEEVCAGIADEVVVAANYNCPGQLVISGSNEGIARACIALKEAGARRALPLQVGGAFHSPLMLPAQERLAKAIAATNFENAKIPVYQNVDGLPYTDAARIKENLISQLTAPVRWTAIVRHMVSDGATKFVECGPGNVLQGLVKKIYKEAEVAGIS